MNSISVKITAKSIVATARMLRSARKEIFFIVEGDDDIALFSQALRLPRSNFISCFGKERLMEAFGLVPINGLDPGTIFLRDLDCDDVSMSKRNGVLMLTSDFYDFEMSLLQRRIFGRIVGEFLKSRATHEFCVDAYKKVVEAASLIGALRHVSHAKGLNIDFKEYKLGFLDTKKFSVDLDEMIRYFMARSEVKKDINEIKKAVLITKESVKDPVEITSGKDVFRVLNVALSRFYKCCNANDCSFETLSRMFRISVDHDDIRELRMYSALSAHVNSSTFDWKGIRL